MSRTYRSRKLILKPRDRHSDPTIFLKISMVPIGSSINENCWQSTSDVLPVRFGSGRQIFFRSGRMLARFGQSIYRYVIAFFEKGILCSVRLFSRSFLRSFFEWRWLPVVLSSRLATISNSCLNSLSSRDCSSSRVSEDVLSGQRSVHLRFFNNLRPW